MIKEIIILARSSKHNQYCIAGVDVKTGEWIRPISANKALEGSVPLEYITYQDGTQVQLLDVVKINLISHNPTKSQPENYLYDSSSICIKTNCININEFISIRGYDDCENIFYNTYKEVEEEELCGKHSLLFVKVNNPTIFIKTFSDGNRKLQFNFEYKGIKYKYFKISDENIKNKYINKQDGHYNLGLNLSVVFSLTDKYSKTGKYYKMAAQLFC